MRESLRQAVEHGVLVAVQATGSFRFRHALLAEAIYSTILPGEREELHAKLAEELARSGAVSAAELAPHWAAAGRSTDALVASVEAARQAEAVFGLAEALAHLERALALWPAVPDAAELVQVDLAELCSWAAELASQTGAAPRAVELAQRAIELVEKGDALRAARLYDRLGRYLHESGRTDAALSAFERVVELVPARPPSAERAQALAALAHGLMLAWRFDESLTICEQALALARATGQSAVELRVLLDLGRDLAYLGRADEGLAYLGRALELAEESGDLTALLQAYISLTDVLTMLGRPQESARVARRGLEVVRPYGIDSTVLVANAIEAMLAIGEWDEADSATAAALRSITANFPYMLLMMRADIELGRGDFEAARAHLEAALPTLREDRGQGIYDVFLAELGLWERRWTEADQAVRDGLARASSRQAAQLRVWFCAKGLRAHAELAALARARRDADAVHAWLAQAGRLIAVARRGAEEASAVTPNTAGWLALAEAEYERARGVVRPELWSEAAETWHQLERPPIAAYCRWREAEALVAAGASRAEASAPLGDARAVAIRIGAKPLLRELELLAERARLDVTSQDTVSPDSEQGLKEVLGLTTREAEVLTLVSRGYTNREIAQALVISVKTASVHVSHILRKLDAPNRLEAAAIAHRLAPPHSRAGRRRADEAGSVRDLRDERGRVLPIRASRDRSARSGSKKWSRVTSTSTASGCRSRASVVRSRRATKTTPPPRARSAAILASSSSASSTTSASTTSLVVTGSAATLKCTYTSEPMSSRMSHTTEMTPFGMRLPQQRGVLHVLRPDPEDHLSPVVGREGLRAARASPARGAAGAGRTRPRCRPLRRRARPEPGRGSSPETR